ncbi:MAG TPA: thiamine-phosphate kinase [Candidatus Angelobacter sp.]|nr:thiamine-phosphate kinase [Candidatus Angelobacter sp.]
MVLTERKLIEQIRRLARKTVHHGVVRGIGDDAAILQVAKGQQLLVTTDLCIEGVHFRREWHPARSVGHRCLTRGLSDVAAMGGEPVACLLSLGLPSKLPQSWVDDFLKGLVDLAAQRGVALAGGDISSADKIMVDIVVTGQVPAKKVVLRSGAKPGDRIFVTGKLGGSAAVLKQLYAGTQVTPQKSNRHFYPLPRLEAGKWLRQHGATAMIDLSDGLSVDLDHICQQSGVSAVIDAGRLPIAKGADLALALHGGEDYELLFTVPGKAKPPSKVAGVRITEFGKIQPHTNSRTRVRLRDLDGNIHPLKPAGWQHFSETC